MFFGKFKTLQMMVNRDKGGYFNCNNVWKLLHSMLLLPFSSGKSHWLQKNTNHCGIVVILDVCVGDMEIKSTLDTRGWTAFCVYM